MLSSSSVKAQHPVSLYFYEADCDSLNIPGIKTHAPSEVDADWNDSHTQSLYNLKAVSSSQWGPWPPFLQFLQSSSQFSLFQIIQICIDSIILFFSVSPSGSCICVSYRLNLFYLIMATGYVIGCMSSEEVARLPFGTSPDQSLCGWNMLPCIFYDSGSLINERLYILCSSECLRPPQLDADGAPY